MLQARLALALAGIAVWGYGLLSQDANVRLVGIGALAVSMVMRFFRGGRGDRDAGDPGNPGESGDSGDSAEK